MKLMSLMCALAMLGLAVPGVAGDKKPAQTKCQCEAVETAGNGWCDACGSGSFMGTSTESQRVYLLLTGTKVPADINEIDCGECRKAIHVSKKDEVGTCDTCHMTVKDGRMYHSQYALTLAGGVPAAKVETACEGCQKGISDKKGYCDHCKVGVVGSRVYKSEKSYEHAVMAHKVVLAALEAAKKCDECALGMLTDRKCKSCDVGFKHGSPVSKP